MKSIFLLSLLCFSLKAQDSLYSYFDGSIVESDNECYSKTPIAKNRKSCLYEITKESGEKKLACFSIEPGKEEAYEEIKPDTETSFSKIVYKGCSDKVSKYYICGFEESEVDVINDCKNAIVDFRDEEVVRKGGEACCHYKEDDDNYCGWGKTTPEKTLEFYKNPENLEINKCWNYAYIDQEGNLVESTEPKEDYGLMIKSSHYNLAFLIVIGLIIFV